MVSLVSLLLHIGPHPDAGWVWDPSVLIGVALLTGGYMLAVGPLRRRFGWGERVPAVRQAAFYLGMLCVFVALCSPLDSLGDEYLFSAHMGQHMLLTFAAPPLWLLGVPGWLVKRLVPKGFTRRAANIITHPVAAFLIFNGIMWCWHLPAAYDLALEHETIHVAEHLMFMAAAVIGWWPVLGPDLPGASRLSEPGQALYLFASTFPCTALAAVITLSPVQLYPFYGSASLAYGLPPLLDQTVGGLLMWLPSDMIFMLAAVIVLYVWLDRSGERDLALLTQH